MEKCAFHPWPRMKYKKATKKRKLLNKPIFQLGCVSGNYGITWYTKAGRCRLFRWKQRAFEPLQVQSDGSDVAKYFGGSSQLVRS